MAEKPQKESPENQKMRKLYKTHGKRKGNSKKYWTIMKKLERRRMNEKSLKEIPKGKGNPNENKPRRSR